MTITVLYKINVKNYLLILELNYLINFNLQLINKTINFKCVNLRTTFVYIF